MKDGTATLLAILVRHAEREYFPNLRDWQQPLTEKGRRSAIELGRKLQHQLQREVSVSEGDESCPVRIIFTSPFLRCKQTAELVAAYVKPKAGVHPTEPLSLTPDEEAHEAVKWALATLSSNLDAGCIMLVGHEPELAAISDRLCGKPLHLKKSEAVAFEIKAEGGFWQVGQAKIGWKIKG